MSVQRRAVLSASALPERLRRSARLTSTHAGKLLSSRPPMPPPLRRQPSVAQLRLSSARQLRSSVQLQQRHDRSRAGAGAAGLAWVAGAEGVAAAAMACQLISHHHRSTAATASHTTTRPR